MNSSLGWATVFGGLVLLSLLGFDSTPPATLNAGGEINSGDTAWLLSASGLVLLMTPGLGLFYGGMVNSKNVISTIFQSFVSIAVVSVIWLVVGFSLAFGPSQGGLIGDPATHALFRGVGGQPDAVLGATIPFALFALFQLKFAIITPALISGAFAERIRFSSYLLFISLWSLCIYIPLAHWTWNPGGIFAQWGIKDFAGGTVVHLSAGMAALACALYLGRRRSAERGEAQPPANIPLIILGTGLLWFGWFGFNAGSSLAANDAATLAFLNTNTASAVAVLAWMALEGIRGRKCSAVGACIAAVVGLVAITPAAGFVSVKASVFIGTIAALVSNTAINMKDKFKFDDTLDVFMCHGLGGMVGMVVTAIFALDGGLITGQGTLLKHHLLCLGIATAFAFIGSLVLCKVTDLIIPMRVSAAEEEQGLDLSQHGESVLSEGLLSAYEGEVGSLPASTYNRDNPAAEQPGIQ